MNVVELGHLVSLTATVFTLVAMRSAWAAHRAGLRRDVAARRRGPGMAPRGW